VEAHSGAMEAHPVAVEARSRAMHCIILMRLWIRIKKVGSGAGSHRSEKSYPDPHKSEKPDLDADPEILVSDSNI
jgi:hypothetical protein